MKDLRLSIINYLNCLPFIYGIKHNNYFSDSLIYYDTPVNCAKKLTNNDVDLAIIPVMAIPNVSNPYIVSDYCISSKSNVDSVMLLSNVTIYDIKKIYLDAHSITSHYLLYILAKYWWKINPMYFKSNILRKGRYENNSAVLAIGNKVFSMVNNFTYKYDLGYEWYKFTQKPFVFACWVSNKKLPEKIINNLNESFSYGVNNIEKAIKKYPELIPSNVDSYNYLTNNIHYEFSDENKRALLLFFDYVSKLF